jgi:hypothetical protein
VARDERRGLDHGAYVPLVETTTPITGYWFGLSKRSVQLG